MFSPGRAMYTKRTRHEICVDELDFYRSESHEALLYRHDPDREDVMIYFDFREPDGKDSYKSSFDPDAPPKMYALVNGETDGKVDRWVFKSGEYREEWKEIFQRNQFVEKMNELSGGAGSGQLGIDVFAGDSVDERECRRCGELTDVRNLRNGYCYGEDTNDCVAIEFSSDLFREAAKKKRRYQQKIDARHRHES